MTVVTLVSGGLDSTLMALMIRDASVKQIPLFIRYGQLGAAREYSACEKQMRKHRLPRPEIVDIARWGKKVTSGITTRSLRIFEDAFLPGRNAMLLLVAASIAYRRNAHAIAIGLLEDASTIFPDQTREFCERSQEYLSFALGRSIQIMTPLKGMSKSDVVQAAKEYRIRGTYSCHAGTKNPCGVCVACREYTGLEV